MQEVTILYGQTGKPEECVGPGFHHWCILRYVLTGIGFTSRLMMTAW